VFADEDQATPSEATTAKRMGWTYYYAGKASFATSATTAISFFANIASVLKPLREFGVFMGFNVLFVWVLLTLIFVPMCQVNERLSRPTSRCAIFLAWMHEWIEGPKNCCFDFWSTLRILCLPDCGWILDRETWTLRLLIWRRRVLVFFALATIGSALWAGLSVKVDTGVPNIFPDDHNQNRGQAVLSKEFAALVDVLDTMSLPASTTAEVCREYSFDDREQCSLFWCEVASSLSDFQGSGCECWRVQ